MCPLKSSTEWDFMFNYIATITINSMPIGSVLVWSLSGFLSGVLVGGALVKNSLRQTNDG